MIHSIAITTPFIHLSDSEASIQGLGIRGSWKTRGAVTGSTEDIMYGVYKGLRESEICERGGGVIEG